MMLLFGGGLAGYEIGDGNFGQVNDGIGEGRAGRTINKESYNLYRLFTEVSQRRNTELGTFPSTHNALF